MLYEVVRRFQSSPTETKHINAGVHAYNGYSSQLDSGVLGDYFVPFKSAWGTWIEQSEYSDINDERYWSLIFHQNGTLFPEYFNNLTDTYTAYPPIGLCRAIQSGIVDITTNLAPGNSYGIDIQYDDKIHHTDYQKTVFALLHRSQSNNLYTVTLSVEYRADEFHIVATNIGSSTVPVVSVSYIVFANVKSSMILA